jgi:hypothetical protein
MQTPEQVGIEVAKEIVKQVAEPFQDVLKRLLGPAATEVGLSLADSARVWRFGQAVRLLGKVKKIAEDAHIELKPVAPSLLFPILDAGTLADDDLQTTWAALLTNAATTNFTTEVLPSFPDILKQLTPAEVRFLNTVEREVEQDEAVRREHVKTGMGYQGEPYVLCPLRKNTLNSASRVMLGNLQRLGLLTPYRERDFDDDGSQNVFEPANYLYLSQFGRAFVRACRPPEKLL